MHPDIQSSRGVLITAYQQLPDLGQELLQLLSIVYVPISKQLLEACFKQYCDQRDRDQRGAAKPAGNAFIKKLMQQLCRHNLALTKKQSVLCHPLISEIATRDAVRAGRFEAMVQIVETRQPVGQSPWHLGIRFYQHDNELLREIRLGIYRQDLDFIEQQLEFCAQHIFGPVQMNLSLAVDLICNNPFDPDWTRTLRSTPDLYETVQENLLMNSLLDLLPAAGPFALLEEDCANF